MLKPTEAYWNLIRTTLLGTIALEREQPTVENIDIDAPRVPGPGTNELARAARGLAARASTAANIDNVIGRRDRYGAELLSKGLFAEETWHARKVMI